MSRTRPHAGYTLIELLITIVIGASILAAGMSLLVQAIRANAAGADHMRTVMNLGRLAEQFRADVHDSRTLVARPAAEGRPALLTLTADDGSQVDYVLSTDALTRTRSANDRVVERDTYPLATMRAMSVRADQASGEAAIVLERITHAPGGDVALGKFELLAVAARPRQLESDKPEPGGQP